MRRKYWPLLLACAILGGVVGALVYQQQPTGYTATVRLFATNPKAASTVTSQTSTLATQRMAAYVDLANSTELGQRLATSLDLSASANQVSSQIAATQIRGTSIMRATVTAPTKEEAEKIVRALPKEFTGLVNSLEGDDADTSQTTFRIVDGPTVSSGKSPLKLALATLFGALLGSAIGLALASLLARRFADRSPELMVAATGLPVVSVVPESSTVDSTRSTLTPLENRGLAYGRLATNIGLLSKDPHRIVIVTAPSNGRGTTSVAVGLARALGERDEEVLLVDAAPEGTGMSAVLTANGLAITDPKPSLQQALAGGSDAASAVSTLPGLPISTVRLSVAPGATVPGELRSVRDALASLRGQFDTVIVDAPPVLISAEPSVPWGIADAALLVVDQGKGSIDAAGAAAASLRALGVPNPALIINRVVAKSLPPEQVLSGLVLPTPVAAL